MFATFSRTRVHVSEEVEHQLQEQVRFYQEELQRESEDNEVFRNSLADLETQLKSSIKEKRELLEKLKHSESLKLEMEELRKENSSLYEEKKTIKNDLERTQLEAKRKNQVWQ